MTRGSDQLPEKSAPDGPRGRQQLAVRRTYRGSPSAWRNQPQRYLRRVTPVAPQSPADLIRSAPPATLDHAAVDEVYSGDSMSEAAPAEVRAVSSALAERRSALAPLRTMLAERSAPLAGAGSMLVDDAVWRAVEDDEISALRGLASHCWLVDMLTTLRTLGVFARLAFFATVWETRKAASR
jgi:hypothetical protein